MKTIILAVLLALAAVPSLAQTAPPFEPYTVTMQEHQAMLNYLGDVPAKYANPVINQLIQMEQAAQQKKAADEAKKKAEAEKPKK